MAPAMTTRVQPGTVLYSVTTMSSINVSHKSCSTATGQTSLLHPRSNQRDDTPTRLSLLDQVEIVLERYFAPRPPSDETTARIEKAISDWKQATDFTQAFVLEHDEVCTQLTLAALDHFSHAPMKCYIKRKFKPPAARPVIPPSHFDLPDLLSVLDVRSRSTSSRGALSKRLQDLDADVMLWTLQGTGCLVHGGIPKNGGLDWEKVAELLDDATIEAGGFVTEAKGKMHL